MSGALRSGILNPGDAERTAPPCRSLLRFNAKADETQALFTCEAVIAESLFVFRRGKIDPDGWLNLISRRLVIPNFSLAAEIEAIQHLMKSYRNIPIIVRRDQKTLEKLGGD